MANSWLEGELKRELRPISAPDDLWSRIHEQRRPLRVRPNPWRAWSIAMASLLLLLAGLVWRLGATRDLDETGNQAQKTRTMQFQPVVRGNQRDCLLCHAAMPAVMVLK